ncbi:protein O-mannosyl-transferase family [candidate division CSSED10-310 bacterium]|uniref:Protein O-mannosyl-transferase family n=1 Tax=candidate division CSSED10-310 bacterium TaxID=2855610 RepID=A0ABV6YY02_UNCC1
MEQQFSQKDYLITATLGVILFGLYTAGACKTVYVGDSGELTAAAATLGIPHPSGYPLYVLLGKLWITVLRFGSVAFRMSLFSVLFASLSCCFLYIVSRMAGLDRQSSLLTTTLLAVSPSFWSQANIQRVYSLNALFVVLAILFTLKWLPNRTHRNMFFAFFICMLGACNHTSMGMIGVWLGLFVLLVEKQSLINFRPILTIIGAGFLGLLPYLYLPLRSRMNPRLDWGDPETFSSFLAVVTRKDYWHRSWWEHPVDFLTIGADYLLSLGQEFFWIGLILALLGVMFWRGQRWLLIFLAGIAFINIITMALHGSRADLFLWHRYYIPSYICVALLAGFGTRYILKWLPRWSRGAVFLLPAVMLFWQWHMFDRSNFRVADDFSRQIMSTLPPGSHLIASDDNILFSLIYLHLVEGVRPDINLVLEGVSGSGLPPLKFNPAEEPVFFTHHPNWTLPRAKIVPVGLVYRIWRTDLEPLSVSWPWTSLSGEDDPHVPKDYLTQNLIGHFHFMLGVTLEEKNWLAAEREFQLAQQKAPYDDVLFYNLGLIYHRNGYLQKTRAVFVRSFQINPRKIASKSDVRALDRIKEIDQEIKSRQLAR